MIEPRSAVWMYATSPAAVCAQILTFIDRVLYLARALRRRGSAVVSSLGRAARALRALYVETPETPLLVVISLWFFSFTNYKDYGAWCSYKTSNDCNTRRKRFEGKKPPLFLFPWLTRGPVGGGGAFFKRGLSCHCPEHSGNYRFMLRSLLALW